MVFRAASIMFKLRFLCCTHRQWLADNPRLAKDASLDALESAQDLLVEGRDDCALQFAGCAFEAAELALLDKSEQLQATDSFADSSLLLAGILWRQGEHRQASEVVGSALGVLERQLLSQGVEENTLKACDRLVSFGGQAGLLDWCRQADSGSPLMAAVQ